MAKNLYVGNLSYDTTEARLQEAFEAYGEVVSARIITDRETGRSRGFGFVEMPNDTEAQAAIEATNGADFMGRRLRVNESRGRDRGGERGGGGGGGGHDRGGDRPRRDW
mgnify:CR=1 FL=1